MSGRVSKVSLCCHGRTVAWRRQDCVYRNQETSVRERRRIARRDSALPAGQFHQHYELSARGRFVYGEPKQESGLNICN